jgi:hypothetical protein
MTFMLSFLGSPLQPVLLYSKLILSYTFIKLTASLESGIIPNRDGEANEPNYSATTSNTSWESPQGFIFQGVVKSIEGLEIFVVLWVGDKGD